MTTVQIRRPRIPYETVESFWATAGPALERIFDSPDIPVDIETYSSVYSKCFNYQNTQHNSKVQKRSSPSQGVGNGLQVATPVPTVSGPRVDSVHGMAGYRKVDDFFAERAKKIFDNVPDDSSSDLARYIVTEFARYSTAAQISFRMLSHMQRMFIALRVQEGYGWSLVPVHDASFLAETREYKAERWGYRKGSDSNLGTWDEVESWAEAGSALNCIVPIPSLAFRRFRIVFLEPLLLSDRLSIAVGELLTSDLPEDMELILSMRNVFRRSGIDPENLVRVKLELKAQ
ncbi:hypothetical protein BDP27DRAFT_1319509 [Rhodocollybia butyracea]|uniref:Uncharacterized protein n=1 Tax=Rhodocollybia butyracea TaxID=206335 RepID=A0A9P5Q0K8_9AGAR|nr:hypothetical protein BDP27DRAFT_1319509 [Rhodocollybia butyracea]